MSQFVISFLFKKGRSHVVYDGLKPGFVNDHPELAILLYVGIIGMHYQSGSQIWFFNTEQFCDDIL